MRNATSIGLFGASALALILGACGGGGGTGRDDGTSGTGNTGGTSILPNAGSGNNTAGTVPAAGTSSTAGSTATGGTGGAAACEMKAGKPGDAANTTIDALDDTNTMFAPAGVGMGSWDFGKDTAATAMGTITPTGTTTLMPVTGGHSGSALHVTGTGLTGWGASLAAFLNGATGSFDASMYDGVAFWIKGTTTVQEGMNKLMIQARMPDVLPGPGSCCMDPAPGGMPTGVECYSGHRTVIDVPGDWAEVRIPWTAFMGPTWGLGSTMPLNPNRIRDINFSFNHDTAGTTPTTFDVWIDDVRFLKKGEMGNVGGGTGGSGSGGSGGSAAGTGGGGSGGGGTGGANAGTGGT